MKLSNLLLALWLAGAVPATIAATSVVPSGTLVGALAVGLTWPMWVWIGPFRAALCGLGIENPRCR